VVCWGTGSRAHALQHAPHQPLDKFIEGEPVVINSPSLALRIQNVACLGLRDQRIRVFLQQETSGERIGRGSLDRSDVPGVITLALLQRQARVAVGQTLAPRLGKRNPAALVITHLALVKTACSDVPAQIGAERRCYSKRRGRGKVSELPL
jgi:hypothetical protein